MDHNRFKTNDSRLLSGSITGKHPVVMNDGKTIIFISDKSKETETREKYELLMNNRFVCLYKKSK
jgi:hypothetical protein